MITYICLLFLVITSPYFFLWLHLLIFSVISSTYVSLWLHLLTFSCDYIYIPFLVITSNKCFLWLYLLTFSCSLPPVLEPEQLNQTCLRCELCAQLALVSAAVVVELSPWRVCHLLLQSVSAIPPFPTTHPNSLLCEHDYKKSHFQHVWLT